jgi:predicted nucleotidyltransferase
MDFGEPFGGLMPGARGAALAVLLRTGAPLTGRRVHALVSDRRELDRLGLITTEAVGRAGVNRINEGHAAIAPLRALASPIKMLTRVVQEAVSGVDAVIVFGSVARGDARADSDIDLVVIAPAEWAGRADLQQQVQEGLGNDCDVLHLTRGHFDLAPEDREPVVAEVLRDGVALVGKMPRRPRVAS